MLGRSFELYVVFCANSQVMCKKLTLQKQKQKQKRISSNEDTKIEV